MHNNRIGVALLDTGVAPHLDFGSRIIGFKDILSSRINTYDNNGHGTHVAGIIGGSGVASQGRHRGVNPECNIIPIKVLDYKGNGKIDNVVKGIDYIMKNRALCNIKVVNISIGTVNHKDDKENNILLSAVEDMWDSGLVVVVAAGNNGPGNGTISIPGVNRKVITVGMLQDGDEYYSGRGPTQSCIIKPDVLAEGRDIISCSNYKNGYTKKSGTSMATPRVTGAISLLVQRHPEITNKEVKIRLRDSCDDVGLDKNRQGWGRLNISKLLAAKIY